MSVTRLYVLIVSGIVWSVFGELRLGLRCIDNVNSSFCQVYQSAGGVTEYAGPLLVWLSNHICSFHSQSKSSWECTKSRIEDNILSLHFCSIICVSSKYYRWTKLHLQRLTGFQSLYVGPFSCVRAFPVTFHDQPSVSSLLYDDMFALVQLTWQTDVFTNGRRDKTSPYLRRWAVFGFSHTWS